MTTSSTADKRPYFRPRAAAPYRGPPTPLMRFLAQHADVIECADAMTRNGYADATPVHTDDALPEIMRATGKDRLTVTQALYAAGQRICYDLVVPLSWWKLDGYTRRDDLDNAWRFRH